MLSRGSAAFPVPISPVSQWQPHDGMIYPLPAHTNRVIMSSKGGRFRAWGGGPARSLLCVSGVHVPLAKPQDGDNTLLRFHRHHRH
jgi:hypothetical protein